MNILIIASLAESLINFRGELIKAIQKKGYEVHAIAPELHKGSEITKKLQELGVITHNVNMKRAGTNAIADLKTVLEIRKIVKSIKPDFVLGYTIKPVIYGTIAAWLAGNNKRFCLITGLGFAFQGIESKSQKRTVFQKIIHTMYKFALSKAELVFFQNPDDKQLFLELGILSEKSNVDVVNGSGVDVDRFPYRAAPQLCEKKHITFLLIARLLGAKGLREYAQAAKNLKQKYANIGFDLVGWIDEGNPDSITRAELERWQADNIINYVGRLNDVRPAIENSHVFVLPSYREGTPRTVLEAMSIGRAIITTDVPGCRETVVDGENGFLVKAKSSDALEKAMERFVLNRDLIYVMGAASRKIVEKKYDVKLVNKHMIESMGL